jgi:hypothetical protein
MPRGLMVILSRPAPGVRAEDETKNGSKIGLLQALGEKGEKGPQVFEGPFLIGSERSLAG